MSPKNSMLKVCEPQDKRWRLKISTCKVEIFNLVCFTSKGNEVENFNLQGWNFNLPACSSSPFNLSRHGADSIKIAIRRSQLWTKSLISLQQPGNPMVGLAAPKGRCGRTWHCARVGRTNSNPSKDDIRTCIHPGVRTAGCKNRWNSQRKNLFPSSHEPSPLSRNRRGLSAWVHKGNRVDPKDLHFSKVLDIVSGAEQEWQQHHRAHDASWRCAWAPTRPAPQACLENPARSPCPAAAWLLEGGVAIAASMAASNSAKLASCSEVILSCDISTAISILVSSKCWQQVFSWSPQKNIKKPTGATSLPKNRKGSPTGNQKTGV